MSAWPGVRGGWSIVVRCVAASAESEVEKISHCRLAPSPGPLLNPLQCELTKYVSPSLPTFASATTSSALVSFNNLCRPCRSDPSSFFEYTVTLELDIRGNPSCTYRIVSASPSTGSS